MKLKILLISPWYPNSVHAQDGNFVRSQAELLARDHEVEVLCVVEGARPQVQSTLEESGVRVIRSGYSGSGGRPSRLLRRRRAWRAALGHRTLVPDFIHAHVLIDGGIVAERLAGELGVPFVVTEHSHRWLEDWPLARKPELWLAKQAAERAAVVIAVSPALKVGMERHGISGRIRVIPNVIATEHFYPEEPGADKGFTFLHVSDFSLNKRLPDLLTAFAEVAAVHPQARLHIAGNGDLTVLEQLIQSSHLRARQITISGPHEQPAVGELMRAADAFVLTSALETQSLVVIEALLSGLPVISTRSGGPDSILAVPGRGYLTPVGDVSALQNAMSQLLVSGKLPCPARKEIHDGAVAEFGRVDVILGELYDQILTKKH